MSAVGPAPDGLVHQIPGTTQIAQEVLKAREAYQLALSDINLQRERGLADAGFAGGQIDPETGETANVMIDKFNRFGFMQRMLRNHAEQQQRAEEIRVQRGLGGRGLGQQQGSDLRLAQETEQFDFLKNLGRFEADTGAQGEALHSQFQRTKGTLELTAARGAIAERNFTVADMTSGDPADEDAAQQAGEAAVNAAATGQGDAEVNAKAAQYARTMLKAAKAAGFIRHVSGEDAGAIQQWQKISGQFNPEQQRAVKDALRNMRGKEPVRTATPPSGEEGRRTPADRTPSTQTQQAALETPSGQRNLAELRAVRALRQRQLERATFEAERAKLRGQINSLTNQIREKMEARGL